MRSHASPLPRLLSAACAAALLACGGDGGNLSEPTTGSLAVTAATTGGDGDADGFLLAVDGGAAQALPANGTLRVTELAPGDHELLLSDLADGCTVQGDNPRTATVAAGAEATVGFTVACAAAPAPVMLQWSSMTSGTDLPLYGVWGPAAADVFAVGFRPPDDINPSQSVILHFDGTSWSSALDPAALQLVWLTGVSGTSGSDVFAVGEGFADDEGGDTYGAILHYDGSVWSPMDGPAIGPELDAALSSVSSSSATEAYAVGFNFNIVNGREDATILRYDGSAWSAMGVPASDQLVLHDVWSRTGEGAVAVGVELAESGDASGALLRLDGATWAPVPASDAILNAVWGSAADDVFAVGENGTILHFDGSAAAPMTSPTNEALVDVWGNSGTDVYAVGLSGTILHYDGAAWSVMPSPVSDGLLGVWTASSAEGFAVGDAGTILHGLPALTALRRAPSAGVESMLAAPRGIGREALRAKWFRPHRRAP